jgi:hypothetical protein
MSPDNLAWIQGSAIAGYGGEMMARVGVLGCAGWCIVMLCGCGYGSGTGEPDGALEDGVDGGDWGHSDGPMDEWIAGDDGGEECATDADCQEGAEWCVEGACQPCDNSGLMCDLACSNGWVFYERNGCHPCDCAPANECTRDADCGAGRKCYAGAFCWDWCPPDDPSCCFGNFCSAAGCPTPAPGGCVLRGCPPGSYCSTNTGCAPSSCGCDSGSWVCTEDCGGGVCL